LPDLDLLVALRGAGRLDEADLLQFIDRRGQAALEDGDVLHLRQADVAAGKLDEIDGQRRRGVETLVEEAVHPLGGRRTALEEYIEVEALQVSALQTLLKLRRPGDPAQKRLGGLAWAADLPGDAVGADDPGRHLLLICPAHHIPPGILVA